MGAGYRINTIQIDYAFVFNLTGIAPGATAGTHRFSLTYRFGHKEMTPKTKAKPKPQKVPEQAQRPVSPAVVPQRVPASKLPRSVDITITPEDIDQTSAPAPTPAPANTPASPLKVEEIQIDTIWDSDYDGVPDYLDKCPDTAPGAHVDETGVLPTNWTTMGIPCPRT